MLKYAFCLDLCLTCMLFVQKIDCLRIDLQVRWGDEWLIETFLCTSCRYKGSGGAVSTFLVLKLDEDKMIILTPQSI